MPQLNVFWWGFNFFFCWLFFFILYVYLVNYKLFFHGGVFISSSNSFSSLNGWLW
uniref:ATP synthase F subunit 8 n=1 Tax=Poliometra prolixa TaxID=1320728 RepID=UPI0021B6DDAF|nr:ATP synthase F subunit 8 [Poliometra prolixa]UWI54394.1 ATP synthase F0 subunit 8 [Poliometra prolixa]